MMIKDCRKQLFQYWEELWRLNKNYLSSYSDQDAGQYGQLAQEFQKNFKQAQSALLISLEEHMRISRDIPRWEKPSLKYRLGEIGRLQKRRKVNEKIKRLEET